MFKWRRCWSSLMPPLVHNHRRWSLAIIIRCVQDYEKPSCRLVSLLITDPGHCTICRYTHLRNQTHTTPQRALSRKRARAYVRMGMSLYFSENDLINKYQGTIPDNKIGREGSSGDFSYGCACKAEHCLHSKFLGIASLGRHRP